MRFGCASVTPHSGQASPADDSCTSLTKVTRPRFPGLGWITRGRQADAHRLLLGRNPDDEAGTCGGCAPWLCQPLDTGRLEPGSADLRDTCQGRIVSDCMAPWLKDATPSRSTR